MPARFLLGTTLRSYRDTLLVDANSPSEDLARAGLLLQTGSGLVRVGGNLALRAGPAGLGGEVIDRETGARRCAVEYEVMVENARRALEASPVAGYLHELPRAWRVVEDHGDCVEELWPTPRSSQPRS